MTITEIEVHDNKGATFFCTLTGILDLGSSPGHATRNTITVKARAWGQTLDQAMRNADELLWNITNRDFKSQGSSGPASADSESALPFGKS